MYACEGSCADDSLENDFYDVIESISLDSFDSPYSITHPPDPTLELKPMPDFLKCIFLGPHETFSMNITSNLTGD